MKTFILFVLVFIAGCSSQPKVEPRTVWINGFPVKENCIYADEQWSNLLPAIGSPNVTARTLHTSEGSYAIARIGNQTYVCNRSELEIKAGQRK